MNPLEILLKEMDKTGISCEITRKNQHGVLEPVKEREIKTITTKSQIATTAHLLARLTKEEKLAWALETKDEGNELYQQQDFLRAMEKYVECLTAADFGTTKKATSTDPSLDTEQEKEVATPPENVMESVDLKFDDNNIDELVLPVLCNLAACCLQLQQWHKAVLFCQQALELRPNAIKALYRQGIAYVNCGEYQQAIKTFQLVLPLYKQQEQKENEADDSEQSSNDETTDFSHRKQPKKEKKGEVITYTNQRNINHLSAKERKNLLIYITKAKQGINKDKEVSLKQREAMRKAFQSVPSNKSFSSESRIEETKNQESAQPSRIKMAFLHAINNVLKWILNLVVLCLRLVLRVLRFFIREKNE